MHSRPANITAGNHGPEISILGIGVCMATYIAAGKHGTLGIGIGVATNTTARKHEHEIDVQCIGIGIATNTAAGKHGTERGI